MTSKKTNTAKTNTASKANTANKATRPVTPTGSKPTASKATTATTASKATPKVILNNNKKESEEKKMNKKETRCNPFGVRPFNVGEVIDKNKVGSVYMTALMNVIDALKYRAGFYAGKNADGTPKTDPVQKRRLTPTGSTYEVSVVAVPREGQDGYNPVSDFMQDIVNLAQASYYKLNQNGVIVNLDSSIKDYLLEYLDAAVLVIVSHHGDIYTNTIERESKNNIHKLLYSTIEKDLKNIPLNTDRRIPTLTEGETIEEIGDLKKLPHGRTAVEHINKITINPIDKQIVVLWSRGLSRDDIVEITGKSKRYIDALKEKLFVEFAGDKKYSSRFAPEKWEKIENRFNKKTSK